MKKKISAFLVIVIVFSMLVFSFACDCGKSKVIFGKGFVVDGRNVSMQVESSVTTLYFPDKIIVKGNASYEVYLDLHCTNEVKGKEVSLNYGNNVYYLLANEDGKETLYHVTINRKGFSAGSVDIEVYYKNNLIDTQWQNVQSSDIFKNETWTPGYLTVKYFKIENVGNVTVACGYDISLRDSESDVANEIEVYFVDVADDESQIVESADLNSDNYKGVLSDACYSNFTVLNSGEFDIVAIALKMKDTASNSCEGENLQIGVSIWAAQSATKPDVFGDEYDKTN